MFNSLSRQMVVSGRMASPASVLTALLSDIVAYLGGELVGHAKAVAHVEGGLFHASTTGVEADIEVKAVGSPFMLGDSFRLDFMCVFHGLRHRKLIQAWDRAVATLVASGLSFTPVKGASATIAPAPRTTLPVLGSLASSFVVLKPCCLIPLLWSMSGGGIAFLQVFEPLESYRPAFMLVTLACLSAAFYSLYFGADAIDSESVKSSVRQSRRIFWFAVIVFVISSLVPIFVPQQSHAMHHSAGHYH